MKLKIQTDSGTVKIETETGHSVAIMACGSKLDDEERAATIVHACNHHYALVEALQSVVNNWSYQFERNGHAAPEWAKEARAILTAVGVRQPA